MMRLRHRWLPLTGPVAAVGVLVGSIVWVVGVAWLPTLMGPGGMMAPAWGAWRLPVTGRSATSMMPSGPQHGLRTDGV